MSRLTWPLRLPALLLIALTVLLPAALTLRGADGAALFSAEAGRALRVSALFAALSGSLTLAAGTLLGLAAARLVPPPRRPAPLAVGLAFLPWLLPAAVAALAWAFLATRPPGLRGAVAWQANATFAWLLWLVADVWRRAPLVALLVCVAARRADPRLFESAALDGAGWRARFFHVALPALAPALLLAALLVLPAALGSFDLPYALTRGEPGGRLTSAALLAASRLYSGDAAGSAAPIALLSLACAAVGLPLLGALAALTRRA